ncbi:DUF1398 family protein [Ancylobacter sp. TS-1]|uniref:DUF1398 family protein n=1 Tax=Ancylobacter sp. TS-1 TaxID=1850374 RepID=UPI001265B2DE|nr:DUF1398 family protein [Ancylobacter sp. TS-1]QFR31995.1 DUF1398 domain-containing protein [Ancylobacter sp. TS-1]
MDPRKQAVAAACLKGAEENTLSFPTIVGMLMEEGFESYAIDFRRARAAYYFPDGGNFELPMHMLDVPVAAAFDAARLGEAIREAQQQVPDYSYKGFCAKAAAAGCAFYVVSFSGRCALYVGRTAETHVERFPD